jgi:hypothetical protein
MNRAHKILNLSIRKTDGALAGGREVSKLGVVRMWTPPGVDTRLIS